MSYASASTQQPAAICALKSPADAIHILEAVRVGLVPRVTRRLTGQERSMIRPGTVWVWEEEETNMRRWTDGRRWGASRVGGGGFLVYTETNENMSPPTSHDMYGDYRRSAREPLIKQTYSTTMSNPATRKQKKFHVVAYSSKHNPQGDAHNPLPLPHQLPLLASLTITPGIWPEWEHRRDEASPTASTSRRGAPPQSYPQPSPYEYPQQPPPRPQERYHPYHDARGPRSPFQQAQIASVAVPPPLPTDGWVQDRGYVYPEYPPRGPAAVGYEDYRHHSRSPDRRTYQSHSRQESAPLVSQGVPQPVVAVAAAAAADEFGMTNRHSSPKMSIGNSLNHREVTLPPLRAAIEGDGGADVVTNGAGLGGADGTSPSEDKRQLDELGRKIDP
ncbi:Gti1/Pac2 family-domain-containing protein [Kockovaella imperatae]|uniref:Gti1/Pac2 family-domain-containing protein n=1 Tax=Kockovaella imperatae TaxID=4999 RepID=A0A1Y1UMF4_9TREE|nr:Gti1/Pac2 family-domain-containing protein [Kockovaella imperatae]ORX39231.1 Gti1/Pac2 family-domain-containing protein [Kockovaella imperatae]